MKTDFKKQPKCERCKRRMARAFCVAHSNPNKMYHEDRRGKKHEGLTIEEMIEPLDFSKGPPPPPKTAWQFLCLGCAQNCRYPIEFHRFFSSNRSTVDWLAHMNDKTWMVWDDFMAMMERFRKATGSFNQI